MQWLGALRQKTLTHRQRQSQTGRRTDRQTDRHTEIQRQIERQRQRGALVLNVLNGSYNGLSPLRYKTIIQASVGLLLIGPLEISFRYIPIKIQCSSRTITLKMLLAKWRPFCLSLTVIAYWCASWHMGHKNSILDIGWHVCWIINMMTSSNGNIFRVTGHLCGEFTGPRWIPHTKASDAELWCFLWSASEQTIE